MLGKIKLFFVKNRIEKTDDYLKIVAYKYNKTFLELKNVV